MTTTCLPLVLADIREAPGLIGVVMMVNSVAGFAVLLLIGRWNDRRDTSRHGRRPAASAFTGFTYVSLACASAVMGFELVSTLGFSLFAALIPRGDAGGYTTHYYSLRAAASAVAVPAARLTIAASRSYRALFLLGGTATLTALVPLSLAPRPEEGARLTRELP